MRNLIILLSLLISFSVSSDEGTFSIDQESIAVNKEGKLIIDLRTVKIQDIMLENGTLIDQRNLKEALQRAEKSWGRAMVEKVDSGGSNGGGR